MGIDDKFRTSLILIQALTFTSHGMYLEEALEKTDFHKIPVAERGLITFLLTESVRYHFVFQHIIALYMTKKPQNKYRDFLNAVLTIAICELLRSRQKNNITLSKYTDIVKNDKKTTHLHKMVRGILGNIDRDREKLLSLFEDLKLIFPKEFIKQIHKDYPDCHEDILHSLLLKPPLCATILYHGSVLPDDIVYNAPHHITLPENTNPSLLPCFKEGRVTIQSFASSIPIACLGDIKDKIVYDICAAPGGKTLQASAKGAIVSAVDISEKRLEKLKENLIRTKLNAEIIAISALEFHPVSKADIVLLDVPCSATGTMRKNPDMIASMDFKNLGSLLKLQADLLDHSVTLLKEKAILIYATCSLNKAESEEQIQKFLIRHPNFKIIPVAVTEFLPPQALMPEGYIRLLPHYHKEQGGMDGFFVCYLRRDG